jgi:hypothetical protein
VSQSDRGRRFASLILVEMEKKSLILIGGDRDLLYSNGGGTGLPPSFGMGLW